MQDVLWNAYHNHRRDAVRREIEFNLEFIEWLQIWHNSGKLEQRGPRKGQYVMARYGDVGPYALGNVRIVLHSENAAELWANPEKRESMIEGSRRALTGRKLSKEHCAKVSASLIGNKRALGATHSEEFRQRLSKIHTGNTYALGSKRTQEQRDEMSRKRKGRKHPPSYYEKVRGRRPHNYGKKASLETRAKMSASQKKYQAMKKATKKDQ